MKDHLYSPNSRSRIAVLTPCGQKTSTCLSLRLRLCLCCLLVRLCFQLRCLCILIELVVSLASGFFEFIGFRTCDLLDVGYSICHRNDGLGDCPSGLR